MIRALRIRLRLSSTLHFPVIDRLSLVINHPFIINLLRLNPVAKSLLVRREDECAND